MPLVVGIILAALYGLLIGSFLNVCIYRIPKGESIVTGSSHCMHCGHRLSWYELFPLFSYLFLRARCRSCKARISPQYPLIEAFNALLTVSTFFAFGFSVKTLLLSFAFAMLLVISIIDLRTQVIPDGLVAALGVCGILAMVLLQDIPFHERLIGAAAVSLPLGIIAVATAGMGEDGGMGWGDVKLMAAAGLLLGWKNILFAAGIGVVLAAAVALLLRLRKGTAIPLGPFLSAGIFIGGLWGEGLISWYTGLF